MPDQKLQLPTVTLCCVDTRSPRQAIHALQQCMQHASFGRVVLIGTAAAAAYLPADGSIALAPIDALKDIDAYSRFMLKELHAHVKTEHALVVQWDGFIVDPAHWRDEYLQWDYIGAPWYPGGGPGYVGNGGFSLRSRKLLAATPHLSAPPGEPEDMTICVHQFYALHTQHDIQVAPVDLAKEFSCEYGTYRRSFGFHGMHNFAHIMSPSELQSWLQDAPAEVLVSGQARKLVKSLMQTRRLDEALLLVRMRRQHLGRTRDHYSLKARVLLRKLGRWLKPA